MTILDELTLVSYVALNVDIILQVRRIHKTKSSRDLSLLGMSIRFLAIAIILVKFISLRDTALIIGQGLIAATFVIYFLAALNYFRFRKKR